MKKNFLMMLALMLTTSLTMMADNDRVINFEQLPAQAQALLKQSFGDKVVSCQGHLPWCCHHQDRSQPPRLRSKT